MARKTLSCTAQGAVSAKRGRWTAEHNEEKWGCLAKAQVMKLGQEKDWILGAIV